MPGGNGDRGSWEETITTRAPADPWAPPADLVERLRPWVDARSVGPEGFHLWLGTILPLLPRPSAGRAEGPTDRVAELAQALVKAAGEAAEAHFRASEYHRDNVLLARRVKALEAILRTARASVPDAGARTETAVERYLPRETKR